jgi:hypothetical protein
VSENEARSTSVQLWRVGSHYGIHVYEGDRPVATFHTAIDARRAVEAVNAAASASDTDGDTHRMSYEELGTDYALLIPVGSVWRHDRGGADATVLKHYVSQAGHPMLSYRACSSNAKIEPERFLAHRRRIVGMWALDTPGPDGDVIPA